MSFLPETGFVLRHGSGYIDFARLFVFTLCSAFFVVRTKENIFARTALLSTCGQVYWCTFGPHRRPNHHRIGESLSRFLTTRHLLRCREPTRLKFLN